MQNGLRGIVHGQEIVMCDWCFLNGGLKIVLQTVFVAGVYLMASGVYNTFHELKACCLLLALQHSCSTAIRKLYRLGS